MSEPKRTQTKKYQALKMRIALGTEMGPRNPYPHPDSPNQTYLAGYAAGLADGARQERRALARWMKKPTLLGKYSTVSQWLTARSRKAKNGR